MPEGRGGGLTKMRQIAPVQDVSDIIQMAIAIAMVLVVLVLVMVMVLVLVLEMIM